MNHQSANVKLGEKIKVRDRLLDAAEILFCEKGYENTSVRDLTAMAACNVAAVNYYFGGKDRLYVEMFKRQVDFIEQIQIKRIEEIVSSPNPTLEALVYQIIYYPLQSVYEKHQRGQVMRLMVREVLNKTPMREAILEEFHVRVMNRTVAALQRIMPGLDLKTAQLIFSSIDSLKLHPFLFMEEAMDIIHGLTFEELIQHIVRFACAAIRGIPVVQARL